MAPRKDPAIEPEPAIEPAHELAAALATMSFEVLPERFALLGFAEPLDGADAALLAGSGPAQLIREGGETTLLVPMAELERVLERHPGAAVERDQAWIRFRTPMAWDLVGFLALITARLAAAGVPVGAVCGFSRDSLFIAEERIDDARAALGRLFPEAR